MTHTLIQTLTEALKEDPRFVTEENTLLTSVLRQEALKADTGLISLLLKHEPLKKAFFKTIEDSLVFDIKAFLQFLSNKEFLPDSYTSYKNKVGLTAEGRYLAESSEVVLSWPYKDCILAGGQDKEDSKRQEVFYNEILARDEIDRLLDPKAFTHFKKYSSAGVSTLESFQRSEDGTITDNLIIKGNNLLALHSLKKEFAGKVKLIYIDPPYNTGNDSFKYNDKFNHSTWLTFMKNRLEVAKELLRDDGYIFIQLDYNESHYCKVLCDDIFDKDNFVNEIIWRRKGGTALGKMNRLSCATDSILWYQKTTKNDFNIIYAPASDEYISQQFKYKDLDGRRFMINVMRSPNPRPNLMYDYKGYKMPPNGWAVPKATMQQMEKENRLYFPESKDNQIYKKIYLDEYKGQQINTLWTDISTLKGNNKEILEFSSGQKPESLIERIIELGTNPGDIVLDYHLGSGTTCAVAHKMGRQYIGVEQMDYIETISVERMKKVIEGEQGGISKSVEWKGGGEFMYMELMQANERFVGEIQSAGDTQRLLEIYADIKETGFINYMVDIKAIDASIAEFQDLSLEKQKLFLIELLDKNMLYVNYEDMGDARYGVSEGEKSLNSGFYSSK